MEKTELTEFQKSFLLDYFFNNERYVGWRNIATTLLEKGKCVVAGDRYIWMGGVGNFIKTSEADGFYGCMLYEFDLNYFMTSEYYKEIHTNFLEDLSEKINLLQEKFNDVTKLKSEE